MSNFKIDFICFALFSISLVLFLFYFVTHKIKWFPATFFRLDDILCLLNGKLMIEGITAINEHQNLGETDSDAEL